MIELPPGACDAHLHVFGPFAQFPLPADRSFDPPEAPLSAMQALHHRFGFTRAVLVHSLGHGMDHGPMLAALRAGGGRYRGVALVRPGTPVAQIAAMAEAGVVGVRFNFLPHLGGRPDPADLQPVLALVRPHGWHVAIHVTGDTLVEQESFIRGIDAPLVIDHMARIDLRAGLEGPAVAALLRLLDTGRVWVKLSGADRISLTGPPYHDAGQLAQKLAAHAPRRVLWGTDWPHVNIAGPAPDDAGLVDLAGFIVPEAEMLRLMLVDNPATFFGFP